jgi:hypothetical protein
VVALTDYIIIDGMPQIPYTDFIMDKVDLSQLAPNPSVTTYGILVTTIVRNAFMLAGVISLFLLIFGGFQFIVAGGDPKQLEKGKAAITGALIGLLLIFGSFWIVQAFGVITGQSLLGS